MRRFLRRLWQDDRGVTTMEWIGLALVKLTLLGGVVAYLQSKGGRHERRQRVGHSRSTLG